MLGSLHEYSTGNSWKYILQAQNHQVVHEHGTTKFHMWHLCGQDQSVGFKTWINEFKSIIFGEATSDRIRWQLTDKKHNSIKMMIDMERQGIDKSVLWTHPRDCQTLRYSGKCTFYLPISCLSLSGRNTRIFWTFIDKFIDWLIDLWLFNWIIDWLVDCVP